ncbi:Caleosin [Klebsormidium nitens]|uniref:Caleosin n=1 Tax=Klebsormidium nitens TaxID=105231 RepID=A0A0U9HUL8_KLENI|nr:Caleosin [Klebsormidium nitens]|eukprot:GAQ81996.1 Caleosin [Klebsormidium nitens]
MAPDAEIMHTDVAPGAPVTTRRPAPKRLEAQLEGNPGAPQAQIAASREQPHGSTDYYDPKGLSVMQQHVEFFDRNKDGVIMPWETFAGFRALGVNLFFSLLAPILINGAQSYPTQDGWLPDPLWGIKIKNIHRFKHGGDSGVYDTEGRFVPEKFEEIWSKYDRDNKGALTVSQLFEMTQGNAVVYDLFGWLAEKLEWALTYWMLADHRGLMYKENVRQCLDGSLFYRIEKERQELQARRLRVTSCWKKDVEPLYSQLKEE